MFQLERKGNAVLQMPDLLDEDELMPTRVRSDRSGAGYQALAPRLFVLSTTFSL